MYKLCLEPFYSPSPPGLNRVKKKWNYYQSNPIFFPICLQEWAGNCIRLNLMIFFKFWVYEIKTLDEETQKFKIIWQYKSVCSNLSMIFTFLRYVGIYRSPILIINYISKWDWLLISYQFQVSQVQIVSKYIIDINIMSTIRWRKESFRVLWLFFRVRMYSNKVITL